MPLLFSAVYRLLSFDGDLILEELLDVAILGLNRLPARTLSQTLHFVVVCNKKQLFRIATCDLMGVLGCVVVHSPPSWARMHCDNGEKVPQ